MIKINKLCVNNPKTHHANKKHCINNNHAKVKGKTDKHYIETN